MISNEKPSAIFKLGGKEWFQSHVTSSQQTPTNDLMIDDGVIPATNIPSITAQLGISVEPLESVIAQVETLRAKTTHSFNSVDAVMLSDSGGMALVPSAAASKASDPLGLATAVIQVKCLCLCRPLQPNV